MSLVLILITIPGKTAQTPLQEINISEQTAKSLSCVWINGRTLLAYPPIPTSASEPVPGYFYHLSYQQRKRPNQYSPYEVDLYYPRRLLSSGSLAITLEPYRSDILSPSEIKKCFQLDQLSNEEFLYYQRKDIELESPYGLYFQVNPYRKRSQLILSIPEKKTSPIVKYAGYLSNHSRFCFLSNDRLFLLNPSTRQTVVETNIPQSIPYFTTDLHSLFLFIDTNKILNAYSIREHKIIWQNNEMLKEMGKDLTNLQQEVSVKAVSTNDQWLLVSLPGHHFKIISSTTGSILASFSIPTEKTEIIKPYREWYGSIWIQFVEKEKDGTIKVVRFVKISQNREKQFNINLYELNDPYINPILQTRLNETNPTYYSYIPSFHKLLILFRDKNNEEIQTVFELP